MSEQEKYPFFNKTPRRIYAGELDLTPYGHHVLESTASKYREASEPAPKHDGDLGEHLVDYRYGDVEIDKTLNDLDHPVRVRLRPKEALSLLAWLKQEEPELQRLAKEQGE